jgi:hypothetical protein
MASLSDFKYEILRLIQRLKISRLALEPTPLGIVSSFCDHGLLLC